MYLRRIACVSLLVVAPAVGQNLVKNGDFEADLASWSGSGPGGAPGVTSFDVTGLGAGKCFSVHPGGDIYAPPHAPYVLQQSVLSVPTWLEMRMDVAITSTTNNAEGGTIQVKVGGQLAGSWLRFSGSIAPGTYRDQICFRFKPTPVGTQPLAIEIQRSKFAWGIGRTPVVYIDNISLRIVSDPIVCMTGERKAGTPVNLSVLGAANAAFALLVAPKPAPAPIPIPGWSGSLGLDPFTMLFLFAGALDANGSFSTSLVTPTGIGGVPLYWQGAQISAAANSLGLPAAINFY